MISFMGLYIMIHIDSYIMSTGPAWVYSDPVWAGEGHVRFINKLRFSYEMVPNWTFLSPIMGLLCLHYMGLKWIYYCMKIRPRLAHS